jgi:hypothetical protein
MAILSPSPKLQFFTNTGVPMAGGFLYTYAAGTSTPLVTYTDSTGLVANTNPVILDSRGEASIWLSVVAYKFTLATPADIPVWTQDNITYGWSTPTSNLALGGFRFTGAGNAVAATDFATYGQLQALSGWAPTADLPMGGFKFTGASNGIARTDFATFGQLQDSAGTLLTAVAGTNTITATLTNLAAYAAGQVFTLIPAVTNTGATTLNINAIGAVAVTKGAAAALTGGELVAGAAYQLTYDGTQFLIALTPGRILQIVAYGDVGGATTSVIPTYVGVSFSFLTITPISATSRLILSISMNLQSAYLASTDTVAYANIYDGVVGSPITNGAGFVLADSITNGVGSSARVNFSINTASTGVVARNFGVSAATNSASSAATVGNVQGYCMEVQL